MRDTQRSDGVREGKSSMKAYMYVYMDGYILCVYVCVICLIYTFESILLSTYIEAIVTKVLRCLEIGLILFSTTILY